MKNINLYKCSFLTLFTLSILMGCEKSIMHYEQNGGVYFGNETTKYTFFENPDKVKIGYDTVFIPVKITGLAMDYDRIVEVMIVDTSKKNTALPEMYTLQKGIVKANMFAGSIPFVINYTRELDDSLRVAVLRIVPNKDFAVIDLNSFDYSVSFGNVAMEPENWYKLKVIFGDYSNSWYSFILSSTGLKSIPYMYYAGASQSGITKEQAERWPMTYNEAKAIGFQVKEALTEYNNTHPDAELEHEDGPMKGTKIKMKI